MNGPDSALRESLEWHRDNEYENAGPDEFGRNLADLGALRAERDALRKALLGLGYRGCWCRRAEYGHVAPCKAAQAAIALGESR